MGCSSLIFVLCGARNANLMACSTFWFTKLVQRMITCFCWIWCGCTFAKLFVLFGRAGCVFELSVVGCYTDSALLLIVPVVSAVKLFGFFALGRRTPFATLDLISTRTQIWQQIASAVLALRVDALSRALWDRAQAALRVASGRTKAFGYRSPTIGGGSVDASSSACLVRSWWRSWWRSFAERLHLTSLAPVLFQLCFVSIRARQACTPLCFLSTVSKKGTMAGRRGYVAKLHNVRGSAANFTTHR